MGNDLLANLPGLVNGNGKADSTAWGCADERVDANHLGMVIDQRPTGIARVDGRVRLDVGDPRPPWNSGCPVYGAHDAQGHAVVEAQRVANGNRPLPGPHLVGVAQHGNRQVFGTVNLDNAQVGDHVRAQHLTRVTATTLQGHRNPFRPFQDMVIGEHDAVGASDKARALAFRRIVAKGTAS